MRDTFALLDHHVDGNGVTAFFGGPKAKRTYSAAERAMFQMLSAHVEAGRRDQTKRAPRLAA